MPKILVVEDDPFIMMWVEDALQDAGYSVLSAANADKAIRYLEDDTAISLIFTDIDMPGSMDGLRLAAAVRDRWPPVHIIIASGKHRPRGDEMPDEAIFIPKPYLPATSSALSGAFTDAGSANREGFHSWNQNFVRGLVLVKLHCPGER